MGLLGEVLQEQAAHRALQADMQFGNLALGDRDNRYPLKPHLLKECSDVFLVPAQPVQPFGDDDIQPVVAGVLQQTLVGGPKVRRPADTAICIGLGLLPAVASDEAQAQTMLILDGGVAL